jgi:hypothetical protein
MISDELGEVPEVKHMTLVNIYAEVTIRDEFQISQ